MMKPLTLVAVAMVACLHGGCTPETTNPGSKPSPATHGTAPTTQATVLDAKIAELQQKVFELPITYEDVATAKRLVRDIIAIAASGDKQQAGQVAEKLAGLLAGSDTFVGYDYYILWLAGPLLSSALPSRGEATAALILKIENREKSIFKGAVRDEIVAFASEHLQEWTKYPGDIWLEGMTLDQDKWNRFRSWHRQGGSTQTRQ